MHTGVFKSQTFELIQTEIPLSMKDRDPGLWTRTCLIFAVRIVVLQAGTAAAFLPFNAQIQPAAVHHSENSDRLR